MIQNSFFPSIKILCFVLFAIIFGSCDKSDLTSYIITIEAYSQDSLGNYIPTGNDLIFDSNEDCQTWSRTAVLDSHSAEPHLHYNAAGNVSFNNSTTTFSWTEYGPDLDQQSIESTCAAGNNGTSKTVNNSTYYQDKPNVFLKITSVVEN